MDRVQVPPSGGYAVAYSDGAGAPSKIIGVSDLLSEGDHQDVRLELREPLSESGTVWLIVHAEDNDDGTFGFPQSDQPLAGSDGVIVVPVAVTVD